MNNVVEQLKKYGDVEENVSLSTLTTLKIGGPCRYLVFPKNFLTLQALMNYLKETDIPYKIFGKGSNLLCGDDLFDGCVIKLDRFFNEYFFEGDYLYAMAGCSIINLASEAMKQSMSGLEFASGIPGTLGGCVYMNAGAYKVSMSDVIEKVLVLENDELKWMNHSQCLFSYRHSYFHEHKGALIMAAKLKLNISNYQDISDLTASRRERRIATQPLDKPSAGSVFRNPEGHFAWQLIENVNLRGLQIGGARVSDKHPNFIVNESCATAKEFLAVVNEIKKEVQAQTHLELVTEVEIFNCQ